MGVPGLQGKEKLGGRSKTQLKHAIAFVLRKIMIYNLPSGGSIRQRFRFLPNYLGACYYYHGHHSL